MFYKIPFPEGVFYIPEKHEYLTKKINGLLLLAN